ncbi:MAG TPA: hypothetical protein VK947_13015 [Planococcus sp. (in: firmicutes)]|nr:hypothetical protein [Planococcus sp. (in: firmicutes)]
MKQTTRKRILGSYNLFLATGAIWIGTQMVTSSSGFGQDYPDSWAANLPFESWVMPGILAIVIFGLGNLIAAAFSFMKKNSWLASVIMGALFLFGLIYQRMMVGEHYIVTNPFLALSLIQLALSTLVFWGERKGL